MSWIGNCTKPKVLQADIIAGITVALVLVPQSMAYAQLAGLPPYYGLYASFLPGIVAALFGSSRQLATGPVAVVSLMTAAALEPLALSPELYVAYALTMALMVGIFQLSLGVLRLGVLVDFLSHPVVIGFTNAAAIIIGTSQLSKIFGVTDFAKGEHQYETIWNVIVAATTDTHMLTLIMGLLAIGIMVVLKKMAPKAPNVLIAVVVTTVLSWMMGFDGKGGRVVGEVPAGITMPMLPSGIEWDVVVQLITTAVIIGIIGFMEAVSIAKAMATQTRQRLDPNQELIGQGLGNLVSGMFQGYTVSGSFSRSAVNISAGAVTGFSSVVTGAVVGITLLFLTPLLYHLPQATLAAVIMMAVINLVKVRPIIDAWKVQPHDGIVAIVTFLLTLIVAPHLETGIVVGVILSLGLFLFRTMRPRISVLSRDLDGTLRDAEVQKLDTCDNISVIRFDGPLYFANTGYFVDTILDRVAKKPNLKFVVIDAEGINEVDATGEEMLHELATRLKSLGIELLIGRAKKQIMDIFRRTGFMEHLGKDKFFRLRTHAFNYAWGKLEEGHKDTCPIHIAKPLSDEEVEEIAEAEAEAGATIVTTAEALKGEAEADEKKAEG
ncbi:MAG: sulfate permease [Gammaproteobacteria bacterium]|nr:sulfate permease [Gammaproteobacteria bacterium]MCK5262865.1 sulfate permease [Gammaproteobacteria bacterium]